MQEGFRIEFQLQLGEALAQGFQLIGQKLDLLDLLQDLVIELEVLRDRLFQLQLGLGQHLDHLGETGGVDGRHALGVKRGRHRQSKGTDGSQQGGFQRRELESHRGYSFTLRKSASLA